MKKFKTMPIEHPTSVDIRGRCVSALDEKERFFLDRAPDAVGGVATDLTPHSNRNQAELPGKRYSRGDGLLG